MTQPTAEQIRLAQEAGNEAMDCALWYDMATPEQAYDAYRDAYDLALAAAEISVEAEHLTPAEVAMLEARTNETERAEDYNSATEGHW